MVVQKTKTSKHNSFLKAEMNKNEIKISNTLFC